MALRALVVGETTFGFHDIEERGPQLVSLLEDAGVEATVTTDRDDLRDVEADVVVDYLTDSTLTEAQLDGLLSFVRGGGGYAGVHCASDLTSYADENGELAHHEDPFPELRELVGGHFLGHPEQQTVDVTVADPDHPATEGVGDFSVYDEPYDLAWDDDLHVLAWLDHPDSGDVPAAWVTPYGEGRVFYCSLGHTEESLGHDEVRTLVGQGARWAGDPQS